ncbi:glutamate--tRNA ligase [Patescibacteria group bacterium]|nr:glutamate--tRNA ligase [Patescibacteria group bacterium]
MPKKIKETTKIRTRFAPSPTGHLHIGGVRTALFNYLFTKQNNGAFVLRIEDTDVERSKKEYEEEIFESLKWLGIKWTEGPDIGGDYGPYRQMEKRNIYKKYLEQLLKESKAYYCFCSEEELEAKRQDQTARGVMPKYDGKCLSLSKIEIEKNLKENKKSVIRLRIPEKKVVFEDIARGRIEMDSGLIGDIVIAKSLDSPLFYLAGVIDDEEMKITHVIRGEEHISNTPKQILIQEALGFKRPIYGHIPLILAPDRSKLSKRYGAVSAMEYKKAGYLPEALINFLAFLGWNPGTEREFFSLAQLVKEFKLENVQKGGAIFNQKRLDFLNGFYIRQKSLAQLTELALPYLIESKLIEADGGKEKILKHYDICETKEQISFEEIEKIVSLHQTRLKKLSEIPGSMDFFFKKEIIYPKELLKWQEMSDKDILESLNKLENALSQIKEKNWDLKNIQNVLLLEAEQLPNRGYLLWPLRVALTGKEYSAGPFEIAEILGREKTLERIIKAKQLK